MDYTPEQIDQRIENDSDMKKLAQGDPTAFLNQHAEIYRNFGYNPDGTPLRTAQKAIRGVSLATGIPEGAVQFGASAVLPTIGTIAGAVAGGPVGASGGSVLGEGANALLGIDAPKTWADLSIAAGAPLVGPAVAKAAPSILAIAKRLVPGTAAGLNELVGEKLASKLNSMRVTAQDVDATRFAMQSTPDFQMYAPQTKAIFNEESAKIARQALLGVPDADQKLKALNKLISANPGVGKGTSISFKDLMTLEQGFNEIKDVKVSTFWAAASGKIIDDLEAAASDPKLSAASAKSAQQGLQAFKTFIATNRKFHADETLTNMFTPGSGAGRVLKPTTGDPTLVQFDKKVFHNMLANNAELKKAFTPVEINSIRQAVADVGYIKSMPSGGGDPLNLAKRYGAGGMIGWLATGGSPMGALAGAGIEELMRQAVSSEPGRVVVKYLAKQGRGTINALELSTMLGKVVAGASAGIVAGVSGTGQEPPTGVNPFVNQQ